ncbi:MAG: hypothetical protein AB4063_01315 [Crocosphaera sp.]
MSSKKKWDQNFWQQQQQQKSQLNKKQIILQIQKDYITLMFAWKGLQESKTFRESTQLEQRQKIQEYIEKIGLKIEIQEDDPPEPIYQKIVTKLPEEYRSDWFQLRESWQKKGLSAKEIKYLTYKHLIHIILVSVMLALPMVLNFQFWQKTQQDNPPELIYQKITAKLPEDYQSNLSTLRERWRKKGLSAKEINNLTYKYLIDTILGLIKVKIQNFFLFRYSRNKDK